MAPLSWATIQAACVAVKGHGVRRIARVEVPALAFSALDPVAPIKAEPSLEHKR